MLNMAPGKMAQAASEIPEGRTFSGIDFSGVTVASSWEDKYDQAFYSKIESEYENGYTTAETALEIGTAAKLAAFAKFVNDGVSSGSPDYKNSHGFENKFVCLTDDIDLQGVAPMVDYQNDGDDGFKVVLSGAVSNNWVPIGNKSLYLGFHGTFDGKNHSILGMVNYSPNNCGGLFAYVSGAAIQNVGVKNSVVITGDHAGKIVGVAIDTTIQNCYATGIVYKCTSSTWNCGVGGISGSAYEGGTIKNCYASGDMFATAAAPYNILGGITGNCEYALLNDCYATGKQYLTNFIQGNGGVIGLINYNDTNEGKITAYYDKDVARDIGAVYNSSDSETLKGLTTAEFKQKLSRLTDETGNPIWFLDVLSLKLKTPCSSDFTFTLPEDLDYDGQGKTITIAPKPGITGMGAVTVKYYKVNSNGTLGAASTTPPTDAGRYKVKFDVASGTEYYSAKDLPAMF